MIFIDLVVLLGIIGLFSIWLDRRYIRNRQIKSDSSMVERNNLE